MRIVDTHNDALLRLRCPEQGLTDPARHVTCRRMREGGLTMMTFAAYTSEPEEFGSMLHMGLREIDAFYTMLDVHREDLQQVRSPEDLERAAAAGRIGALLSVEGGNVLEGDLHVLRLLHRLGVRMFGLCWSLSNEIATGCRDTGPGDRGLLPFGREVVRECDRLRMMVDLSHASDRTFWQVLEIAQNPVCASHSCARSLCPDQMRNLTDEMLTALGARGGYVGVNFSHDFLVGGGLPPEHRATVDDVVRHIEHMAERAGVHAVGIGSDFDGIGRTPVGLEDCGCLGRIAEALLRRNWSEADVCGIMGENFLAYWKRVLDA